MSEPADLTASLIASEADKAAGAALVDFCHALLNSNEFVYRF